MTLFDAIDTADQHKIRSILKDSSEYVTEEHLHVAITNHDVDKAHCKQLFDTFKTPENIIPASCIIAALDQSRIDIFLSIIRTNHPDAPTESSTTKVQRAILFRGLKPDNEAKYEQHKASFFEIIQQTFSPEDMNQLHTIIAKEDHPIQAVIGSENLNDLLAITTPDGKENSQTDLSDAMSTGTPPPEQDSLSVASTIDMRSSLPKQESIDTLNSSDLNMQSTGSNENTSLREQEEQKAAQEEEASLAAEQEEATKQLVIEEADGHINTLRDILSLGLGDEAYAKIQTAVDNFAAKVRKLALNPQHTQEDMSDFRTHVKTEIIPQGQAALLANETHASFFCRKIMDALHVIFNMLAPVLPCTKNSFFQTAPSVLAERFETSEHGIATAYGS